MAVVQLPGEKRFVNPKQQQQEAGQYFKDFSLSDLFTYPEQEPGALDLGAPKIPELNLGAVWDVLTKIQTLLDPTGSQSFANPVAMTRADLGTKVNALAKIVAPQDKEFNKIIQEVVKKIPNKIVKDLKDVKINKGVVGGEYDPLGEILYLPDPTKADPYSLLSALFHEPVHPLQKRVLMAKTLEGQLRPNNPIFEGIAEALTSRQSAKFGLPELTAEGAYKRGVRAFKEAGMKPPPELQEFKEKGAPYFALKKEYEQTMPPPDKPISWYKWFIDKMREAEAMQQVLNPEAIETYSRLGL